MEFQILGPLEVLDAGRPLKLGSTRQRTLLAALLVHAGEVVSFDRLVDILWGDAPPVDTTSALHTHVSRLRHVVNADEGIALESKPPGYVLRLDARRIDAVRFEDLVTEARALATSDPVRALVQLTDALSMWRGPALAEFADADFARAEAARLDGLRLAAIGDRVDLRLALGQHAEVLGEVEALVAAHPLQERPRAQLMLALYGAGRQVEALRAFQDYREFLREEMGLEPSAALRELERRMVRQDADLDVTRAVPSTRRVDAPAPTAPALRTVHFLCTDIEGSTNLWETRPDEMRSALARHDAILGDAVAAHGGVIFKTTGDGAYATLPSVPDAVAAAVDAMRALSAEDWGPVGPLSVRMAIHTGEVEERDGDYYGPALNRTNRLMNASRGGQMLLTSAAAELARDALPDEIQLLDLGSHRMRGISEPEHVHQLQVPGLRSEFPPLQSIDAFPSSLPAPRPSFARATGEFANRTVELERLEHAWKRASEGNRRVALVAGESGIGKTRLIAQLGNLVHAQEGAVLYGRCDEDSVIPYQPFVEALQPYVAAYPSHALHERLHGLEQDLTRLFPELLGRIGSRPSTTVSDPEAERYRLFEALTSLLTGVAAARPALFVVDDLHWADRPTLLLLRHAVRAASGAPLLIVAAYRDLELPPGREVDDLLTELGREAFTERIALVGLSEADADVVLRGIAGGDVAPEVVRALHRGTAGNPFFLAELLRTLQETDGGAEPHDAATGELDLDALGLPKSVRDVVARRVRRLPDRVIDVLGVASVIGLEFSASLVARAGDWSPTEVLESLDQASDAGLVQEDLARLGSYVFAHNVIRRSLYAELGAARKTQLHAGVAAAIEQDTGVERSAAVLAEHYRQALVLGTAPKALEYTRAAAREAAAQFAYEDAARYFDQALELLSQHAPDDVSERVELLIERAEVLLFVDETAGVDAVVRAVRDARAHGSADQLGRAVVLFEKPVTGVLPEGERLDALLDEAQAKLGDDHPALRARLMAMEAFKYSAYQLAGRDGRAIAARAIELARQADDPTTLTSALWARALSLESTTHTDERRSLGEELVALGRAGGRSGAIATHLGLRVLAGVHLELAEAEELDAVIAELDRTGSELRWLPAVVFAAQWRATQALVEGRFADVRGCWDHMRHYARAYRAVSGMEAQQIYYLAREQGDLAALVRPLQQFDSDSSDSLYVPAMLAVALLDAGDDEAARRTLESITPEQLQREQHESAWGAVLALLAEVAAGVGCETHAALLDELLAPFTGRLVVTVIGLGCLGAADRHRGMLSATLGRHDEAAAHFERALALEERIRGHALLPRTKYWQARSLLARAEPGDDAAARAILEEVVSDARSLGMRGLGERAAALLAR